MRPVSQPTILETIVLPRKLKPDEKRRVERLGKLNDARKQAVAVGDAQTLLALAKKYKRIGKHGGCPMLAAEIRIEAKHLGKGRHQ